jgi:NAD-dependent SIR2 family protein deacetylase
VLTGAGCSTASGIPDYRDENGEWKHRRPVQFQDFLEVELTRKRYWARSMLGWPLIKNAKPSTAHHALKTLEEAGLIHHIVTQNVDSLHRKAGSSRVLDLHGNLETVSCLSCDHQLQRSTLQLYLHEANPLFNQRFNEFAPDGDVILETMDISDFKLIPCPRCDGILKPDVVFFGQSVPKEIVAQAMQYLHSANGMLVLGSSLMVYSGYRFCLAAIAADKAICALNRGRTRADDELTLKIDEDCGVALDSVTKQLGV